MDALIAILEVSPQKRNAYQIANLLLLSVDVNNSAMFELFFNIVYMQDRRHAWSAAIDRIIMNGNIEMLEYLINNIEYFRDKISWLVASAVRQNNYEMLEWLLNKRPNISDCFDCDGNIMWYHRNWNPDIIAMLKDYREMRSIRKCARK